MKVVVTGARGFIGAALLPMLEASGHEPVALPRGPAWDPERGVLGAGAISGAQAIVHLAGENVAAGRWTAERKRRILDSRVNGTSALARAAATLPDKPAVFVSASAIGYYGDCGDELQTEHSSPGKGFLACVCKQWEAATGAAAEAGIRTVRLRFGVVLSARGGALAKMLPAFRLGLGGPVGSGRQYVSWIALEDAAAVIVHAIANEGLDGAVNAVSPNPVRNAEFAHALGHALGRPAVVPVPAIALKLAFGDMAKEVLLASQRVEPRRLLASRFPFRCARLEDALRAALQQR
ncbi:MAG TPA: TIGR01777 family oxidoreductase [Bryobacteraceae bacterium]|nr:TIGR01777 family oxidoreductase [Bryobacteraceae bacterium]